MVSVPIFFQLSNWFEACLIAVDLSILRLRNGKLFKLGPSPSGVKNPSCTRIFRMFFRSWPSNETSIFSIVFGSGGWYAFDESFPKKVRSPASFAMWPGRQDVTSHLWNSRCSWRLVSLVVVVVTGVRTVWVKSRLRGVRATTLAALVVDSSCFCFVKKLR